MKRFYEQINETRENMGDECVKAYDHFIEQCLESYGINMINARENAYRVFIQEDIQRVANLPTYQRFYIDGAYAFTVIFKFEIVNEGGLISGTITTYERVIEKDHLPITNEESIRILSELAENCVINGDAKTFRALVKAVSALESEKTHYVPDWIYRDIPETQTTIDFDAIEKALGFKLFYWQKTYIAYGYFRQYGYTTARILRDLFDPNLMNVPIDYSKPPISVNERLRRENVIEIKEKLNKAGVKTRKIKTPSGEIY